MNIKELMIFILMFVMYCIVSSLDFQLLYCMG